MNLYCDNDQKREKTSNSDYRTPYRRDYSRLVHSPSFRRLKCKTQLFPEIESDFFRNRLSHSMEVAQIAKSIALKLNTNYKKLRNGIDYDLVEFAGLAHDLGHPPFGHNGEKALDNFMKKYGGFEGNAQTLRILSKLEKKEKGDNKSRNGFDRLRQDTRLGLNLCYRTLASILKYDKLIPLVRKKNSAVTKGYYHSEKDLIKKIKTNLMGKGFRGKIKTIECQIMDIADDIAYSTYDLEDCLKARFTSPLDLLSLEDKTIRKIIKEKLIPNNIKVSVDDFKYHIYDTFSEIFADEFIDLYKKLPILSKKDKLGWNKLDLIFELYMKKIIGMFLASKRLCDIGYNRVALTSKLVSNFIDGVKFKYNKKYPQLSKVYLEKNTKIKVEIIKQYTFEIVINSPMLKIPRHRGFEIVSKLCSVLDKNPALLPEDFRDVYLYIKNPIEKKRLICDFVSGMTDRYAIEYYGRLFSEKPETIFKPIY